MQLPKNQYNNVIRCLLRGSSDRALQIRNETFAKLRELKTDRDSSKAVTSIPGGSDQVDMMSIVLWIRGIKPGQKKAIGQLIAIDATAVSRS